MEAAGHAAIVARHVSLGDFRLDIDQAADGGKAELVFTDNETNTRRVFGFDGGNRYVKDAFHDYVIHGDAEGVNSRQFGTKAAAIHRLTVPAGAQIILRLRLTSVDEVASAPFADFDTVFANRNAEADAFYAEHIPADSSDAAVDVARQAYAGLLWSKQFYHYIIKHWLAGDANEPRPLSSELVPFLNSKTYFQRRMNVNRDTPRSSPLSNHRFHRRLRRHAS